MYVTGGGNVLYHAVIGNEGTLGLGARYVRSYQKTPVPLMASWCHSCTNLIQTGEVSVFNRQVADVRGVGLLVLGDR